MNAVSVVAEAQGISDDLDGSKAVLGSEKCVGYRESDLLTVVSSVKEFFRMSQVVQSGKVFHQAE